jgi:hypothetical protein
VLGPPCSAPLPPELELTPDPVDNVGEAKAGEYSCGDWKKEELGMLLGPGIGFAKGCEDEAVTSGWSDESRSCKRAAMLELTA